MRQPQIPPQPGEVVLSCGHHVSRSPVMERPDEPGNATHWLELVPHVQAGPVESRWIVICDACCASAGGAPLTAARAVSAARVHWTMPDPRRSPLDNMRAMAPGGARAIRSYLSTLDNAQLMELAAQRSLAQNDPS